MEPRCGFDKFRLREIEQRLAGELQSASQQLRLAFPEEKRQASEAHQRALERFTNFAAKGIVPQDLLPT
jgi:hypothetical protein